MEKVLLDTNILLNAPFVLENDSFEFYICEDVLKELDRIKIMTDNEDTLYKIRRATRILKEQKEKLNYIKNPYFWIKKVDDRLIKLAKRKKFTLLTEDILMELVLKCHDIQYKEIKSKEEFYTGVKYLDLSFDKSLYSNYLEYILESNGDSLDLSENEYLIVRNIDELKENKDGTKVPVSVAEYRYSDGKLNYIDDTPIKNSFCGKVSPLNPEQKCLFDLLNSRDITILSINGDYGTGKSFILFNYALQELEKGHISKIIFVPNNSFSEDSREIGALPGELLDKEIIHMGTLIDIVGVDYIKKMVQNGTLEIAPVSVARGRNFKDAIVFVNEAQNLTDKHVKLLIGRCAENGRIFFDGDIKQTDSIKFRNKNGLKILPTLRKSRFFAPIFGSVRLKTVERSKTAMAAAYLDEIAM